MEFDPAATAQLADLSAALDHPRPDLAAGLTELDARLRSALPGYVGLTVLASAGDRPVSLTFVDHGTVAVGSSLTLCLGTGRVSLVLYATAPGTFVDLAADVSWLLGAVPAVAVLDRHLTVLSASPPAPSNVDQAIGVLLGRGHLPAEADRLLHAYATRTGTTVDEAATHVLQTTQALPGTGPVADAPGAA